MALGRGKRVGGDYLDLRAEAREHGPFVAIFRIVEFLASAPGDFGALRCPVLADVLIVSGPRAGEAWMGEEFFGAPTNGLRGVANPKKGEPAAAPATAVGQELVFRIEFHDRKGSQPFVGLEEPSDADYAAAEKVYEAAGGEGWGMRLAPAMAGANGRPF